MKFFKWLFLVLGSLGLLGLVAVALVFGWVMSSYGKDLPDHTALKDYQPKIVTRVYGGHGHLISEFATEKRIFMPIQEIPDIVKQAFISAEDKNFYQHGGIDFRGVVRAVITNAKNFGKNRRLVGASTITQQVVKNFLLTNEVKFERKIKEAILAYRMENALSKERILELYLNEIYLGIGAYGVAAAALEYFDKPLKDVTLAEAAYFAALPKAPNNYHPIKKHDAAIARRNWVLDRMVEDGYVTDDEAQEAKDAPLKTVSGRSSASDVEVTPAPYFVEQVRRELNSRYGKDILYGGGLSVKASVDQRLQKLATKALRDGLEDYDRRHGYRGRSGTIDGLDNWQEKLKEAKIPPGARPEWSPAVVLERTKTKISVGLPDGSKGRITSISRGWSKSKLKAGDIVFVKNEGVDKRTKEKADDLYSLRQIPKIQGALVAMDPHTGRVLAMEGGFSYDISEFNRATQARRQPGSAFKPFVYLAAMNNGFTPATLVMDAPVEIDQGPGLPKWRPKNYGKSFSGPTPVRKGLEKSKNMMTVRMAHYMGVDVVGSYAKAFGINDDPPQYLSMSLGSLETTPLRMTAAYAMLINGGKKITPTFIDRIQDRRGTTVFVHDQRPCKGCGDKIRWEDQAVPKIPDLRKQISDPRTVYQVVSMMEGVVKRGTGIRLKNMKMPLAGKTGTTNDSKDAWFMGCTPNLVVGVYTGFDEPKSLGRRETGSSVALPIFQSFIKEALKDTPAVPFRIPSGLKQARINSEKGTRARPGDEKVIWESFLPGTEPGDEIFILDEDGFTSLGSIYDSYDDELMDDTMTFDQGNRPARPAAAVMTGTGGIY